MRLRRKSIGGMSATSAAVHTACTPGSASAASASIARSFPCAKCERTTRIWSCPANEISAAKRPRPVSSGRSSRRVSERPTYFVFGFAVDGAIDQPSGLRRPPLPHLAGDGTHGLHDVLIAGAAAEIGREHVGEFVVGDIGLALQHAGHQHQKAGRTEAALQAVMLHERALQGVKLVAGRQAFEGADLLAFRLHREHQAGTHRRAIDEHRAGAAHAVLATDMRPGLPAILANSVDQRAARLDANGMGLSVDRKCNVASLAHTSFFLACRSAARMRCGVAGISLIVAPNGVSASLMALRMAAGAPIAPPSPSPFARVIVASLKVSRCISSIGGISWQVGGKKSASVAVSILPLSSYTISSSRALPMP